MALRERIEALKAGLDLDDDELEKLATFSVEQQAALLWLLSQMGVFNKSGFRLH
jgi:hypothetical protein